MDLGVPVDWGGFLLVLQEPIPTPSSTPRRKARTANCCLPGPFQDYAKAHATMTTWESIPGGGVYPQLALEPPHFDQAQPPYQAPVCPPRAWLKERTRPGDWHWKSTCQPLCSLLSGNQPAPPPLSSGLVKKAIPSVDLNLLNGQNMMAILMQNTLWSSWSFTENNEHLKSTFYCLKSVFSKMSVYQLSQQMRSGWSGARGPVAGFPPVGNPAVNDYHYNTVQSEGWVRLILCLSAHRNISTIRGCS